MENNAGKKKTETDDWFLGLDFIKMWFLLLMTSVIVGGGHN